ncbi:MAG: PKD domain-containing protein [Bacteroidota bacterium]
MQFFYKPDTIPPVADFTAGNTNNCLGAVVNFTDMSSNFPSSWYWDFGDGGTDSVQDPSHVYTDTGTFTVTMIVFNDYGQDTMIKIDYITIIKGPDLPACTPTVINTSMDIGIYNVFYNNINNTTGSLIEGYTDYSCFNFTNTLVGSKDTISVQTNPDWEENVRVWIDYNNDGTFDSINELVFTSDNQKQYHTGIFFIPQNAVTGTMLRMRVASDYVGVAPPAPCSALTYGQAEDYGVIIQAAAVPPDADFIYSFIDECQGIVEFTDYSAFFPTNWIWDFGDGNSVSGNAQVINTYQYAGTYYITLIATNAYGSDTIIKSLTIDSIHADFITGAYTVIVGDSISFDNISFGANSWLWDFGDDSTITVMDPVHIYDSIGIFTVWLYAVNTSSGCSDSINKLIEVLDSSVNIKEYESIEMVNIIPIPSSGIIYINYYLSKDRDIDVSIYNLIGEEIFREKYIVESKHTSSIQQIIDLTSKPKGMYFIKINTGKKVFVRKIILE